jgi:hypothetical protein
MSILSRKIKKAKTIFTRAIIFAWIMASIFVMQAGCSSNTTLTGTETATSQSIEADRRLIYDYVKNGPQIWLSEYDLNDQFSMTEPYTQFRKYQAKLYRCSWDLVIDGKDDTIVRSFLMKNDCIYEILTWGNVDRLYETDFDHDRTVELIYYTNIGSGRDINTFYVIEPANEESIYITQCEFARPKKVMNHDLIIEAMTRSQQSVTGKLKYRIINGVKDIYIDAGKYTDQLQSLSQEDMNANKIDKISIGVSKVFVDDLLGKTKYQTHFKKYDLYDCLYILSGNVVRTVYIADQVEAFFITRTNNRLDINLNGYEYLCGNMPLGQFSYYDIDGTPEYILSLLQNGTGFQIYYEQFYWGCRGNYYTFAFANLPYGAANNVLCDENEYYSDENFKDAKINSINFQEQIFIYLNRKESYPSTMGIVNTEKIDIEIIHELLLDWSSIDYRALIRDAS